MQDQSWTSKFFTPFSRSVFSWGTLEPQTCTGCRRVGVAFPLGLQLRPHPRPSLLCKEGRGVWIELKMFSCPLLFPPSSSRSPLSPFLPHSPPLSPFLPHSPPFFPTIPHSPPLSPFFPTTLTKLYLGGLTLEKNILWREPSVVLTVMLSALPTSTTLPEKFLALPA